ncbi:N-acetylglucosamine/diacetylchitobiose ABC transporter substrate-binding protein [Psychromicrobium lacuslunae]|uniref:Sugar ABC transporter sugar-binding protein n=1 Tax=Psychromicrobium lacuslunae TaxID=1618207 RepID=A0A0D4C0U1_9MICC|nr:N-acetylglucosamine/diacetylchitobiose ABC transporter substrate-binding protein [Psychromicrobium lacuslunae]AJT42302.1 sugar ABC transporter sugar-binding protein [Psychromicrobium lacuslunae]
MSLQQKSFERRGFLRGALAAAVLVPLGGTLASCASGGGGGTTQQTGAVSDGNPFGVADSSTIDAVVFDGGYGTDYVQFAADLVKKNHSTVTPKVSGSTDISGELQPRFAGGTPPDLFDNSGAKSIGISTILAQLEDLNSVIEAKNLEGTAIKDTLYPGVTQPGTFDGKFVALNYALTVYAVWYSASLFEENGWTPPKTWDEALDLGAKAAAKGKKLFVWGKQAATYYMELAVTSAIKEGGDEVRLGLENLKADAWSHPAIQSVLGKIAEAVQKGYFVPGGSGTDFKAAQAQWTNKQDALLYPSGSWIENEMKDQTKAGFKMTGIPAPTVSSSSKMPYEALHSAAGEPFMIPSKGNNVAGAKELLRTMLSKDAATNFAKTKLAPTIVKGTVPADGFGSTALVSQSKMIDGAGDKVFTFNFNDFYGTNKDLLTLWNSFLDGKSDVATLTSESQKIFDKIRNDSSVTKVEVK